MAWFRSYLTARIQRIPVKDALSEIMFLLVRVVQVWVQLKIDKKLIFPGVSGKYRVVFLDQHLNTKAGVVNISKASYIRIRDIRCFG